VTGTKPPGMPMKLGPAGERFWNEILAAYELSPGEVEVLRQAAQVVDVLWAATETLVRDGMTVRGSMGQQRPNPMLAVLADQRRVLETLVRSLALPMPGEVEGQRRSPQQQAAAQARWREQRRKRGPVEEVADAGPESPGPV
jgi:hypothetical protein